MTLSLCLLSVIGMSMLLAGCMPSPETNMTILTSTLAARNSNLPLVLNQPTVTPGPTMAHTSTPTPSMTHTPTPTATGTPDPAILPDLTIPYDWRIDYDDPCPWGSSGTITLTVQNIGSGDAGLFVASMFDEESSYDSLPAGGEAPLVYDFLNGPVGNIDSEVDIYDQVVEGNETNNVMMIVFTPPPPCGASPMP